MGAYLAISGAGQITTGTAQLVVAATARSEEQIEKASVPLNAPIAATTVLGFGTLLATGGDIEAATKAASVESVATTAFIAGASGAAEAIGGTAAEKGSTVLDFIDSIIDLLSGSDKPKPETEKPAKDEKPVDAAPK